MESSLGVVLTGLNRPIPGMPYRSYWNGLHSTLAARTPIDFYRVHYLKRTSPMLLAVPNSVESVAPLGQSFGGIAELRFATPERAVAWQQSPAVALAGLDEQNNFAHVAAYWTNDGGAFTAKDEIPGVLIDGPQGLPTFVVLVRRASSSSEGSFLNYLRARLVPALVAQHGIVRLGVYLLGPYNDTWGSPNVGHDETGVEYHAWLELTFRYLDAVAEVMRTADIRSALADAADIVSALHGYNEYETYTYRVDGRPTYAGLRGYDIAHTAMSVGALNQFSQEMIALVADLPPELGVQSASD